MSSVLIFHPIARILLSGLSTRKWNLNLGINLDEFSRWLHSQSISGQCTLLLPAEIVES